MSPVALLLIYGPIKMLAFVNVMPCLRKQEKAAEAQQLLWKMRDNFLRAQLLKHVCFIMVYRSGGRSDFKAIMVMGSVQLLCRTFTEGTNPDDLLRGLDLIS